MRSMLWQMLCLYQLQLYLPFSYVVVMTPVHMAGVNDILY